MNDYLEYLLKQNQIKIFFDIFEIKNNEFRLVGGSVRDTLLGNKIKDIDVATNILPSEIIDISEKNNLKYDKFAIKYGSISVLIDKQKFQITTLRKDINQMGRDTDVLFTSDWRKDAERRDFSINAIYLSKDGIIYDYFNGIKDLNKNKLKFIGNKEKRIKEDYLRILRYYRFLGLFKNPNIIKNYELIFELHKKEFFLYLSNDVIRNEILKMFNMKFPLNCFFNNIEKKEKRSWLNSVENYFVKTKYNLGLNHCLNKINLLIK